VTGKGEMGGSDGYYRATKDTVCGVVHQYVYGYYAIESNLIRQLISDTNKIKMKHKYK
jgi:hypothetical protein